MDRGMMETLRHWLGGHSWMAATGATAALVFVVTFFAVSAATDADSAPLPAPRVVSEQPTPPGVEADVPAVRESDAEAEEAVSRVVEVEREPTVVEPEPSIVAVEEPVEPEAAPTRELPEYDEESLIFGGDGNQGAILAGRGIVRSSGTDNETPWRLVIPSSQINARLAQVGVTASGAFGAPDNPDVIGWWRDGPAPGELGNVLLDGHRDFRDIEGNVGTGVCWQLPDTGIGDAIIVQDFEAQVSYLYEVIETTSVAWNSPEGVAYLQSSDDARLTLVTCEGSFDADESNYSNRRIVVAKLTDTIPF